MTTLEVVVRLMRQAVSAAQEEQDALEAMEVDPSHVDVDRRADALHRRRVAAREASQWAQVVLAEHAAYKMFGSLDAMSDPPAVPLVAEPGWIDDGP